MKKKNVYLANDEIDLSRLISLIFKKKFYILFLSVISSLLFFFYGNYQNNIKSEILGAEITIKKATSEIFVSYSSFMPEISDEFNNSFFLNLSSHDNLDIFLKQSKSFDDFKVYLKSINSTAKQYFTDGKFRIIAPDKFFFTFPKKLDGKNFLKEYVEFNKNKTIIEFKKRLKRLIEYEIEKTEKDLQIAKIAQVENAIFFYNLMTYKGSKILELELVYLKKLLSKLENEQFNYDHLLDSPSFKKIIDTRILPLHTVSVLGFFFGLFFCIFVIFFKDYLRK
jgi:LPS O-antigen subunit length determinant protein (WzzB/FepE family)